MGWTMEEIGRMRLAYQAGAAWPEIAKAQIQESQVQIAELQETVAAQTALLNKMYDRIEHLERIVHRHINDGEM